MPPLIAIGVLMAVIILVVVALGKPEHMDEKRKYMFEDENGEKDNPFSDMNDGVEDQQEKEWKYSPNDF